MSATALRFRGVVKRYGMRRALDGLDFDVPVGSLCGLVGSNGAGKTTALGVAAGVLHCEGGKVDVLGGGPFDATRHAGRVTLLPQDSRMPPHARADQMLRYYGRLQGLSGSMLDRAVDEAFDIANLESRRRSSIRSLSHGMMRRLAVAQSFLGAPELVLLDEPLNGLDPREVVRARAIILARRGRQTMVISSHLLQELEAVCDHVVFIEDGRLVHQGSLAEMTRQDRRLTLLLGPGACWQEPLLARALPGATATVQNGGVRIVIDLPEGIGPVEANARLLPELFAAGVPLLEVRCGSHLETIYLATHEGGPAR